MAGNQNNQGNGHGGRREGAGRRGLVRSILRDTRFAKARGIDPLYASEVLAHVIDERRAWQRIFQSPDDRVLLDALKFLTLMRDGKPAQRIHVTSTSVQVTLDEVSKARAIVAEILGTPLLPERMESESEQTANGEESANAPTSIMLSGDQGGEMGGSG